MYKEWLSLFMEGESSKFAGWLIYFPPLPNCVSMSQNSTGGSSTTSFTLQECTFPVGWFSMCRKCLLHSVWTVLYPGLHLRSYLPCCLFLKYTLPSILKKDSCLSIVFCAVLEWFSSNVFLAIAKASLWASWFNIPESSSPRKHCMGSKSWCRGKLGSPSWRFHILWLDLWQLC